MTYEEAFRKADEILDDTHGQRTHDYSALLALADRLYAEANPNNAFPTN